MVCRLHGALDSGPVVVSIFVFVRHCVLYKFVVVYSVTFLCVCRFSCEVGEPAGAKKTPGKTSKEPEKPNGQNTREKSTEKRTKPNVSSMMTWQYISRISRTGNSLNTKVYIGCSVAAEPTFTFLVPGGFQGIGCLVWFCLCSATRV